MKSLLLAFAAILSLLAPVHAFAGQEDDVKTVFQQFVAAQNAHDINAVGVLLEDSPDFLWITRGSPIWGKQAALDRFNQLYQGTWHLEPEGASLKVKMCGEAAAEIYAPVTFTIGEKDKPAQTVKFMLNQVLVKTKQGWKITSIIPVQVPAS